LAWQQTFVAVNNSQSSGDDIRDRRRPIPFDEVEDSGVNGRKLCIACYRFVICCWRQSRGGHDLVIGSVAKFDETVDIFRLQGLSGAQAQ
jgi:hypothetical protein